MKKKMLLLRSSILAFGVVAILAGCSKDDLTAPNIVLTGDDPQTITLGQPYTELGATASDDQDGDISTSITTDATGVNANQVGTYDVTYSVSDKAGNVSTKNRTVNVVAVKSSYAGNYHVTEDAGAAGTFTFDVTISAGAGANDIVMNNFGGYGATVNVVGTIGGTLGDQIDINYTTAGATFTGSGTLTTGTTTTMVIALSYTADDGTDVLTATDTFTKF